MLRPRTPLFNAATESADAGGGAPAPAPAPAAETPAVETPPAKPGVIDSAIALFRDKGQLTSEIATLRASNGQLTAQLAAVQSQLAAITTERDNLAAGFARLEAALKQADAEKTTLQAEVTNQLAAIGIPEPQLPAAAAAPQITETAEEVWAQAEAESDPVKKGQLAAKAQKLQSAKTAA